MRGGEDDERNRQVGNCFRDIPGLISDDEMISARLSRLDRKREKLQRQQAGIYESMDAAE